MVFTHENDSNDSCAGKLPDAEPSEVPANSGIGPTGSDEHVNDDAAAGRVPGAQRVTARDIAAPASQPAREQGFRNGHDQMAVAGGIDRGMVNVVTEDHKKASLQCFFDSQTPNADRSNGG
ncbi:MAG: hypothetical protein RLZZ436_988 [Planctomycetota bacterium]